MPDDCRKERDALIRIVGKATSLEHAKEIAGKALELHRHPEGIWAQWPPDPPECARLKEAKAPMTYLEVTPAESGGVIDELLKGPEGSDELYAVVVFPGGRREVHSIADSVRWIAHEGRSEWG